jgi:hypothetical protein
MSKLVAAMDFPHILHAYMYCPHTLHAISGPPFQRHGCGGDPSQNQKTVIMRGSPCIGDATATSAVYGAQSRERN